MLGEEVGPVAHRLLIHRRAQQLGAPRRLRMGLGGGYFVSGHDDRASRRQQPLREALQRRIARAPGGLDPCRPAELQRILLVQNVAGERDEHRAGGRGRRHLRRPADDARQVLQPGDFHRPFHEGLGDRQQRCVEHGLGEPVALLLLAGGDDDRRAHPVRVEERAHGIAEARRDMNVADAEIARGARVAVRHRHHKRLLQRHDVGDRRPVGQRRHDRKLGGAGVAEEMRHPLALEQREEGLAAEDGVHGVRHDESRVCKVVSSGRMERRRPRGNLTTLGRAGRTPRTARVGGTVQPGWTARRVRIADRASCGRLRLHSAIRAGRQGSTLNRLAHA